MPIRLFVGTLAGVLLSGLPQSVLADCGGSVCRQRYVNHEAVAVVEPVLAATFVPVAVAVPQYSVGPYATGYAPSATPTPELDALRAEVEKLTKQIETLKATKPPESPVVPGPPKLPRADAEPVNAPQASLSHLSVFSAKCAACHSATAAASKGGGLVLLKDDKTLANLTDKQVLKLTSDVYSGRMPKKGEKLTDQEVGAVMQWVEGLK